MLRLIPIYLLLLLGQLAFSQPCKAPGQNPETALPVCGTAIFNQSTVPICGNRDLVVPGCTGDDDADYGDKNPFWYQFTCFESGSLGFLIKPADANDDYDWQLYDITGRDPRGVYTNPSWVVTGNWSGSSGNTGASESGVAFIQCASNPRLERTNTFAKMPQLLKGHVYLLLVSHYSDSQSGYALLFSGGTAVITDPTIPRLKTVERNCDANQLGIKLSKKIRCSSIAADGSDFTINTAAATITGSIGLNCSTNFDTDSVVLQLSAPLPPGTYIIGVKTGSDQNTLLDFCENALPRTDDLKLTVVKNEPTKMDSLLPPTCAPQQVRLFFQKPIRCASVAADGSNFKISGTYPVVVTAAAGACKEDISKEIILTFNRPLQTTGSFTITLQKDFDGNTILDVCGEETPAGSSLSFSVKDTVSAAFNYTVKYGCARDTISVTHIGANAVTNWAWNLDDNQTSTTPAAQGIYRAFEKKDITLIVSNGFCTDTVSQEVPLENYLTADFTSFADLCPQEAVQFNGMAQGLGVSHHWDFGDGSTASQQSPTYTFATPERQRNFVIRYTVTDQLGCTFTVAKPATVYTSCYLAVPNAFTPNNDGLNDYLAPMNAVKANDLTFSIFNRWGQLLYKSSNWKQGWDGTFKGQPQPTATYVWMLQYTDRDSGKKEQRKGTAVLIR